MRPTPRTRRSARPNPWDTDQSQQVVRGSATRSPALPLATGSDGGGSIRIPSAVTGLTGFKPSLGRVPSGGAAPPDWPLLSTKGPMARTARDLALVLDAVVGPEPTDLASLPLPEASWSRSLEDLHPPRAVVWSPTLGYAPVDAEVRAVCEAAVRRLEEAGTAVEVVDRSSTRTVLTMPLPSLPAHRRAVPRREVWTG